MVWWHHRLNGHGFGWTPGVGDGQGGLACCGPWGCKELDTAEWLNWMALHRALGCFTIIMAVTWHLHWLCGSSAAGLCRQDPYIDATVFSGATGRKVTTWVSSDSWRRKAVDRYSYWDRVLEWFLGLWSPISSEASSKKGTGKWLLISWPADPWGWSGKDLDLGSGRPSMHFSSSAYYVCNPECINRFCFPFL